MADFQRVFVCDSGQPEDEPVFTQFRHNARGAIDALVSAGCGVAVAALYHPQVGDIDLRYGKASDNKSRDYGLAKLVKWHPEALVDLQGFIGQMDVVKDGPGRIFLSKGADVAVLSKDWMGKTGNWLLTAYGKTAANAASETMDTACFCTGGDTALSGGVGNMILGTEHMEVKATFDDGAQFSALSRLKMLGELARIKGALSGASALARLKMLRRVNEIRLLLTGGQPAHAPAPEPQQEQPEPLLTRATTAHLFTFDSERKPAQRKKDNAAAMALLARVNSGEVPADSLTDADKALLAKYSGTGGGLVGADGKKGSAYEYYTPKPIAAATWSVLAELGFSGGKVLDPCAATGVFGATAPASAVVDAVELNQTSGQINRLVNGGPGYAVTVAPFERVAASTPDEEYDAVVANVPFGEIADRGGNQLLDNKHQNQPLQNYFILRSLEKLRPGGLAAFITPPRCLSGKGGKEEWLRQQISYVADFIGAYRLPNSVFGTASADTITDVIFLRKFSADVAGKVAELREQSPQTLLDAKVIWPAFVGGNYFTGEGARFVLGEFQPKNPNKIRDVDRVINPANVEEIAGMLRKLPDSRIDWSMLDAAETAPITYADGDTVYQGGQTLQMQDGRWVAIKSSENSTQQAGLLAALSTPYAAFEAGASWADAKQCMEWMTKTSQVMDIPGWLRDANSQISALPVAQQGAYWTAGVVGLCVSQVLDERSGESLNYLEEYAALSDAMRQQYTLAKKRPGSLSGPVRDGLVRLVTHYQGQKAGFNAVWRGDVEQDAPEAASTADSTFDGIVYRQKTPWVSLDEAEAVFGEGFAPLADPAWCVSPDGQKVIRADDYYVGNYGDLLARLDVEIAVVQDEAIRAKLLRQKADAAGRVVIDTIEPDTQDAFEAIADKLGLALDVTITPKLSALIENVKAEMASPRGVNAEGTPSPIVKQIIFCDILPLHNKIKRLLTKHAGIPASKIAVVTGKKNNKPDQIMAVQDGFNAEGDDNRFDILPSLSPMARRS